MGKILCVLYEDPVDGYPKDYARDSIPKFQSYLDAQSLQTPHHIDFVPGHLLGSLTGGLGLKKFLEDLGHTFIVTSDKEGENSVFEKHLIDADVIISQPFWPAYLTKERLDKAKKLKLAITAGIGIDHVDLQSAIEKGITVAEVTYSNSNSATEHIVMQILSLVRNYIPSYKQVIEGRVEHRLLR
jgi:formate dehydrogenase